MAGAVGRPRKNSDRRRGNNAREEILDAAAELFTTKGFSTTSTHEIADAVGMRQASLYYHFPSKSDIFLTLLKSTVEPSMVVAAELGASDITPEMRLWAQVAAETRHLLSTRWNVGKLYQLPMASSEEFTEFHRQRGDLSQIFRDLAAEIVGPDDPRTFLPRHIAQSVVDMRPNDGTIPFPLAIDSLPEPTVILADAALAVLNAELPERREETALELITKVQTS
ncbi:MULTISPECIES: TetR/AcrR family transcriptional regulator [Corynebacterium]|uniref:TetR/AcrR family transcriptional regulator n=1 Tax=Corynebacterium TaxID=1716 RepID=UPI00124CB8C7|nr:MULTISPECIES: TetR/AcrR family transcriptional regulator [Corynebacterium]